MKLKILDMSNSELHLSFKELHFMYIGLNTNPYDKNIILIYSRK